MIKSERIKPTLKNILLYSNVFFAWTALGILMGVLGGSVGALFSHSLEFASNTRVKYPFVLYLLPVGALIIVLIYRGLRLTGIDTNSVFETVRDEREVPMLLTPAVFIGTFITHLLGGSAGREGAALQMGGSIAALIGNIIRIDKARMHILTMCGMSALFSSLFGTPVGACVFAFEVATVGKLYTAAMFPCMVSSVVAHYTAGLLGVTHANLRILNFPKLNIDVILKVFLIGVIGAIVSILFCVVMHGTQKLFAKFVKNPYLRALIGGLLIIGLTLIFNEGYYNGSGEHVILLIFAGKQFPWEAFLVKILFTAITIGSGFKGGEIVPTLFIGATLGSLIATLIGTDSILGAAVGIAALFCGVTNCPIAAIIICAEMFGGGAVFFMISALTSYLLSGQFSLYTGQNIKFSKLDDKKI